MLNVEFTGADVLGAAGFEDRPLSITDGVISDQNMPRRVDLAGFRILPGIIDVHGDGFERHLAPRRGAMKQMHEGLLAAEAELAANGITTGVMAQFASWEGGLRSMDFADQVLCAIRDTRGAMVTDIRPQLRFETHLLDDYDGLPEKIADWGVEYVVFNDHLPHDRLAEGRKPPRVVGQALKAGRNPEVHFAMMLEMHRRTNEVPAALDALCARLQTQGVQMGSHDDSTQVGCATWQARGVHVAEFPETLEAAEATTSAQGRVVLGAPNVVRGGSHKGNVSALDLIIMGHCDAIASDYHYPSPRRAALMLAKSGAMDFAQAWGLVSKGPAEVLGLKDRGQLKAGLRADLVVLDAQDKVAATLSQGRVSYMSGDIAYRFVNAL
ncbi:alpha-D-ribose 1-methylphosphonate 5-triphosphate diphosphatase [Ascidiaceihabitans sp.]|uniref:alpha-D-ribose 1-methylphosphonate 5-triphosphate diphosphatase n=1 Tax=Ascidiaceihabitans sp. TaxID=1872644 RepID=UPI003296B379